MYQAFTGSRFILNSSATAAKLIGHPDLVVDDLLVFHIAFGKTVADVSFNAVANLGYANIRFEKSVFIGDTISVVSEVIGLRENKNGKSGIVYVESIAKILDEIDPPYWSEHIAFTECHGLEIGHLTPLPYTEEALEIFNRNIETVRSIIQRPLILENITYILDDPIKKMSEAEFLNNLFHENQDIGMLLDITNLYINSKNHNYDYREWLKTIDTGRVVQIHYVGHDERNGLLIDNHSYPTQDGIWDIMRYIKSVCPNLKGSILERDNKFDSMDALRAETRKAKEILFHES